MGMISQVRLLPIVLFAVAALLLLKIHRRLDLTDDHLCRTAGGAGCRWKRRATARRTATRRRATNGAK